MAKETKNGDSGLNIDFGTGKLSLGGLFDGIGKLVELAEKLEASKGEIKKEGEINFGGLKKDGQPLKGVFGFSIKTATGGKQVVEPFGNIKKTPAGPVVEEEREPLIDIFDEKKEIVVMAEMPGVGKNDIKIDLKGDLLEISAKNANRNYRKEILLPAKVKSEDMTSAYNNGILEIRIKK
ncbi:MAG: archaeal heat shock protein Hsp20 [Lentisphaerota bacterium]|jgi:HSP20 family protein